MKIELDHHGIEAVLKSEELQHCLQEVADGICSRCPEGYATDVYMAETRAISSVYTETFDAMRDNLENNTILKAMR